MPRNITSIELSSSSRAAVPYATSVPPGASSAKDDGQAGRPEVVENGIDTPGCEPTHLLADIVVVVDRFGAEGAQRFVVARGRGAQHPDALVTGQLDQDAAHAAAGAVDQDRLAGLDPGAAVQHLIGRDAVDHHGFHLGRIEPVRHRHQIGGGNEAWLAQPPVLVAAATRVPTRAGSTSVTTAATVPTRS